MTRAATSEQTVAILMDYENARDANLQRVLAEAAAFGRVIVRRAYADWTRHAKAQNALREAGFEVLDVREETIEAKVSEWFEFLTAYHDAVLGWVGGTKRIDGADPTPGAVRDRLHLIRHAMETLFGGRPSFNACWTYITAHKP